MPAAASAPARAALSAKFPLQPSAVSGARTGGSGWEPGPWITAPGVVPPTDGAALGEGGAPSGSAAAQDGQGWPRQGRAQLAAPSQQDAGRDHPGEPGAEHAGPEVNLLGAGRLQ